MKILFISDSYFPHINGVYYFVCRIGSMLQDAGHQVAIIAPSSSTSSSIKKIDGLDVYGVPSVSVIYYPTIRIPVPLFLKSRVRTIIKQFNPDIIHLQDHSLICNAAIQLNRKLKIPIIGTNHFMAENITGFLRRQRWKQRLETVLWKGFSKAYNQVKLVTTPSETGVNIIRSKLKVDTIAISSGINLDKFNPYGDTSDIKRKYGIPNKPILLSVGRLDPEKHVEEILQAVAIAIKNIDFSFVVVGKGTRKIALEQLAHKLGISKHVLFTGFVPDEDLPYFYKLSRCFIIASTAELLSLTTLQAMASAKPIIAVNAGALPELVRDGKNGYLYNEGDISNLVQCIEEIISSDELYIHMGEKSLEYVQQHDIYKTLAAFEKLYENNMSQPPHVNLVHREEYAF
ncbi:MAG: glycosyltransferase [Saprospiraceae bacterium]